MKSRDLTIVVSALIIVGAGYLFLSGSIFAPNEGVKPTGVIREYTITAEQWEFTPNTIEADLGDTLRIEVLGLDDGAGGGHAFSLSAFGINKVIRKDNSVVLEFVAEKSGSFTFSCSVPCGTGHGGMRGTLKVN